MDQAEYDRRFKGKPITTDDAPAPELDLQSQSIMVDGRSVAPLKIHYINATPREQEDRLHESLQERVEVVGMTEDGRQLIRRHGGGDYGGNDQWIRLMRRVGRLR